MSYWKRYWKRVATSRLKSFFLTYFWKSTDLQPTTIVLFSFEKHPFYFEIWTHEIILINDIFDLFSRGKYLPGMNSWSTYRTKVIEISDYFAAVGKKWYFRARKTNRISDFIIDSYFTILNGEEGDYTGKLFLHKVFQNSRVITSNIREFLIWFS